MLLNKSNEIIIKNFIFKHFFGKIFVRKNALILPGVQGPIKPKWCPGPASVWCPPPTYIKGGGGILRNTYLFLFVKILLHQHGSGKNKGVKVVP